ncbi:MAG: 50S ribosomal protein P1 [Candidatus Bathyarchaeia archaeon]|nr:50S ribosomal protein P1 [Candidatus Bathyarchaeia archaeon]MDI6904856.1 50S ribosomal protein P1 [Candidatus Bathyarchaeia archaeon]
MEYIYAAMLLHKAGKKINEENLTQVLTAAGINVDTIRIKALMASLAEVNIEEAIKSAPTMMAAPAAPAAETKPTGEEKKKKEEEEKAKEEAALEGLGALFG